MNLGPWMWVRMPGSSHSQPASERLYIFFVHSQIWGYDSFSWTKSATHSNTWCLFLENTRAIFGGLPHWHKPLENNDANDIDENHDDTNSDENRDDNDIVDNDLEMASMIMNDSDDDCGDDDVDAHDDQDNHRAIWPTVAKVVYSIYSWGVISPLIGSYNHQIVLTWSGLGLCNPWLRQTNNQRVR